MHPSTPHGGSTSASILLQEPLPAQGSLSDALSRLVLDGTQGTQVIKQAPSIPFRSVAFPGLLTAVRLRPTNESDEGRIFAVLDAGAEHITVIFSGGPDSLPLHKDALDRVLTSLRPHLGGGDSPFSAWSL